MAKTYREVAIEQMIATVEEAMSRVIDWWGDLPMPMHEAIDSFRVQLGAAIDSVEFVNAQRDSFQHDAYPLGKSLQPAYSKQKLARALPTKGGGTR